MCHAFVVRLKKRDSPKGRCKKIIHDQYLRSWAVTPWKRGDWSLYLRPFWQSDRSATIELGASVAVAKIRPKRGCVLKPRVAAKWLPWVLDSSTIQPQQGLRL